MQRRRTTACSSSWARARSTTRVAALEYAKRLKAERERFAGTLEIVMRVYFEKPRTTVGWKGLINDPYLDESYRIDEGLRIGAPAAARDQPSSACRPAASSST